MTTNTLIHLATFALATSAVGCAKTDASSDTGASASNDELRYVDGDVVFEDGSKRPLTSGLAYIDEGDLRTKNDDQLVVMLSSFEISGCNITEWYQRPGNDWNVIAIEVVGGERPRVQINQPILIDEDGTYGSQGWYPRNADAELEMGSIEDLEEGQLIFGSMWTGSLSKNASADASKTGIVTSDADFTVKFCGPLSDI